MTTTTRSRLTPQERRRQLLDLGVRLLATRSIDELSIDVLAEEAGVSRGLLYHYFGNKHAFHAAVVRRAADELIERTDHGEVVDPMERLAVSIASYLDYVEANYAGYLSLVKGAASGDEALRAMREETRTALTARIFEEAEVDPGSGSDPFVVVPDTATNRLLVAGWSALAEEVALTWVAGPGEVPRARLLAILTDSLLALVGLGD